MWIALIRHRAGSIILTGFVVENFSQECCIKSLARTLYERRSSIWVIVLYAVLAYATVSVLRAAGQPWPGRLAAVFVAAAFARLGWVVIRRRAELQTRVDLIVPSLLALLVLAAVLAEFQHTYLLLFLFVCGYAFRYLPVRWGFLVSGVAVVLIMAEQIVRALPSLSPESLLQAITHNAWLFVLMLIAGWIAQLSRVSRERQRAIDELNATQGRLVSAERQAGVLEERARLAREIHDTLAQGLVSIVMHLEAAEQALPGDAPAAASQHLDQARRAARENLAEARRFVWALQPQALERDALPQALARAAGRWRDENHIPVAVAVTGDVCTLAPEFEVTLLRAAQEALANVSKHARARQVNLTLSYMSDQVVLDVNDDGVGFDLSQMDTEGQADGFGLAGMRQRVERLGGQLQIESAAGEGTTLVVAIPTPDGVHPDRDGDHPNLEWWNS